MHRRPHGFRRRLPLYRGVRALRLQRRLFVWFGVSILVTGAVVGLTSFLLGPGRFGWQRQYDAAQRFVGGEFAAVWDDPYRREALANRARHEFDVDIVLEDAEKRPLDVYGSSCRHTDIASRVEKNGTLVGFVRICGHHPPHRGFTFVLVLAAAGFTLWAASGLIARRLVRPFGELVRVTEEIGAGNLGARTRLDRRAAEVGVVGEAINRMADRIERQIADQRELLAGVSHELRSPLARVRLLLELGRTGQVPAETLSKLDEIEKEIVEIDELVGELLASSRLDFAALEPKPLDARELGLRALERANLPAELLRVEPSGRRPAAANTVEPSGRRPAAANTIEPSGRRPAAANTIELDDTALEADPTLVSRALSNLLDNARRHAGGPTRLAVSGDATGVEFVVEDRGPGFAEQDLPRVFDSFVRRERTPDAGGAQENPPAGSLGLGLALVRRIALAHQGRVWAENRAEGGARVGMRLARHPTKPKGTDATDKDR